VQRQAHVVIAGCLASLAAAEWLRGDAVVWAWLAGIAGLLNVLSTRLARIIDRARVIERRVPQAKSDEQRQLLHGETSTLWTRIALINWAIRLCVSSALVVCVVIVALFVGDVVAFNIAALIAILFVVAMLLIIVGLVFLLREISVATKHMRAGMELALEDSDTAQPD
jgi:O-antigen/teichoic acid export membrane protein